MRTRNDTRAPQKCRNNTSPPNGAAADETSIPTTSAEELQAKTVQVLSLVTAALERYLKLTAAQYKVLALWALHTWVLVVSRLTPYLNVTGPEKRSGKSRVLEVLQFYVFTPWLTGGTTVAALIRKIATVHPTLLLDESDATFKRDKEYVQHLRGVLNNGFSRNGCYTMCIGQGANITYHDFNVFCPKAFAGIDKFLPDTVRDRSIPIAMVRKKKTEIVAEFEEEVAEREAKDFQVAVQRWALQAIPALRGVHPRMPERLHDRQRDVSRLLLAIADIAGDKWPEDARTALVELFGSEAAADDSLGVKLLENIYSVFFDPEKPCELISSELLCQRLNEPEEWCWGGLRDGKGLNQRTLAALLKPYGIHPHTVRLDSIRTPKGYATSDFSDAWERYSAATPPQPASTLDETRISTRNTPPVVADQKSGPAPHKQRVVADVADQKHGKGEAPLKEGCSEPENAPDKEWL